MYEGDLNVSKDYIGTVRGGSGADQVELRQEDESVLEVLRLLKIDSDPEIIRRLMLLNIRRRALGKTVENVSGVGKDGGVVEKRVGTHLEHTLNLVNVCDRFAGVFSPEWRERNLHKIKSAAILHDLGKTGPVGASQEEQRTFVRLFSFFEPDYETGKNLKNMPIREVIERHSLPEEKGEMLASLTGLGLSPDQPMSEVFGRHVDYTFEILKSIPNVDPEIIFLAASHHRGLRNYPYRTTEADLSALLPEDDLRAQELDEAATIIELSDVFEALSSRGQPKDEGLVLEEMARIYQRAAQGDEARLKRELDIINKMRQAASK